MFEPKGIALAVAVVVLFGGGYLFGSDVTERSVRLEVAEKDLAQSKKITDLQNELMAAAATHSREMTEIQNAWGEAQQAYTADVAGIRAEYGSRLQLSETRAGIYQRQAKGSALEQERLAAHAAELDRSLTEGRSLVEELRAAIGQRDSAIRALGSMILTDRKFFSPE